VTSTIRGVERAVIDRLTQELGADAVLTEQAALRTYECDGLTGYRVIPSAVVLPASTAQVAAAVAVCHEAGVPFVARGAGTGLSGGALPVAEGIVISLARMNAVLDVDIADERVTVQPGVSNLAVTEAVSRWGYFYAPDPSSQAVCSIGGNVAENSGGAHCLKYGFTVHHVCGVTLVTAAGHIARIGGHAPDPPGLDLLAVIVGSEGTLGIVTEITLRILPRPKAVRTLLAAFDSMAAAGNAVSQIIAAGVVPAAVEMMDRLTREAAEAAVGAGYPDCEALLLVEVDGPELETTAVGADVDSICRAGGASVIRSTIDDAERAAMWRGRRSAFAAMGRVSPSYYVQDGVIPRTRRRRQPSSPGALRRRGRR
jgi:glycolate oxidase